MTTPQQAYRKWITDQMLYDRSFDIDVASLSEKPTPDPEYDERKRLADDIMKQLETNPNYTFFNFCTSRDCVIIYATLNEKCAFQPSDGDETR